MKQEPAYRERWLTPPRVVVATLVVAVVAGATLHAGADGARAVVPYVLFLSLAVGGLLLASRGSVTVAGGVLHVPGARIPLDHLGGVRTLDTEATRRVRGPHAQPRALVVTRGWLRTSVQVQVEDPEDDTPYWLVGTRDPEALAAALRSR